MTTDAIATGMFRSMLHTAGWALGTADADGVCRLKRIGEDWPTGRDQAPGLICKPRTDHMWWHWRRNGADTPICPAGQLDVALREVTSTLNPRRASAERALPRRTHNPEEMTVNQRPPSDGQPSMIGDRTGPLRELFDVLTDRFPDVTTKNVHAGFPELRLPGEPELYVQVSCRDSEPRRIIWDGEDAVFRWNTGPDAAAEIGALDDVDRVAETIARALGAGV